MRATAEAFPYRYEWLGLEFSVDSFRLDEGEEKSVDGGLKEVSLETWDSWEEVEITVEIDLPKRVLENTFPEDEDRPGKLVVAVDCLDTHRRFNKKISEPPIEPGKYTEDISLEYDQVHGKVELKPLLIRDTSQDSHPEYATYPGQRVSDDMSWTVYIDEDESSEGNLEAKLVSFEEKGPEYREYEVYHLDTTQGIPKVWLNQDHDLIADVLDTGDGPGYNPKMRDVISYTVSQSIATDLVMWTLSGAGEDGTLENDWQWGIVEDYISKMDRFSSKSVEEIPSELHHISENMEEMPRFMSQLDTVLQKELSAEENMTDMIEEVRSRV
jgi:hypothetical protein